MLHVDVCTCVNFGILMNKWLKTSLQQQHIYIYIYQIKSTLFLTVNYNPHCQQSVKYKHFLHALVFITCSIGVRCTEMTRAGSSFINPGIGNPQAAAGQCIVENYINRILTCHTIVWQWCVYFYSAAPIHDYQLTTRLCPAVSIHVLLHRK